MRPESAPMRRCGGGLWPCHVRYPALCATTRPASVACAWGRGSRLTGTCHKCLECHLHSGSSHPHTPGYYLGLHAHEGTEGGVGGICRGGISQGWI